MSSFNTAITYIFCAVSGTEDPSEIVTNIIGTPFTPVYIFANIKNILVNIPNPNFNFLWLNLNERDPYFILVIFMVATMFLTTKMTTTDPKQSFIAYVMPVVFGAISWSLPSGILVYWVTTNIWSIGQQYIVNRLVKRGAEREEEKNKELNKQKRLEQPEDFKSSVSKKKKRRRK